MTARASGQARIRPLTSAEIDSYDLLGADLARRVRLIRVPPVPGPYIGLTLGRFVILARNVSDDGLDALVAHELVHVRQWAELGLVGFLYRYLGDFGRGLMSTRSWNRAYRAIGLEQEARDQTQRWHRRRTGGGGANNPR